MLSRSNFSHVYWGKNHYFSREPRLYEGVSVRWSVGWSVRNAFFGGQRQYGERLMSCTYTNLLRFNYSEINNNNCGKLLFINPHRVLRANHFHNCIKRIYSGCYVKTGRVLKVWVPLKGWVKLYKLYLNIKPLIRMSLKFFVFLANSYLWRSKLGTTEKKTILGPSKEAALTHR